MHQAAHSQLTSVFDQLASEAATTIGVPDRGAERAVALLGFWKLVKFGQMGWEIRAFLQGTEFL